MNQYDDLQQYNDECPRCGERGIEHLISYSHCLNCGYSQFGSHDKCLEHNYFEAMQVENDLDKFILENELPDGDDIDSKEAV